MMNRRESGPTRTVFLDALSLFLLLGVGMTQTPGTGAIAGEVVDVSGAVVPAARVYIVSEETNLTRTLETSREGTFRAPLLPPGHYSVTVESSGFKRREERSIRVLGTETAIVKVVLEVGASKEEIRVTGASQLAQTETSALGRATEAFTIVALPLANRNFSQILALSPGVVVAVPDAGRLGKANTQNVSANGAKTTSNNFQFNGVDANNISENSASGFDPEVGIAIPAPDSIEEFKVQTGMYDAGYGRGAGANVDIVSKSGTNAFHGNLWEFFRNDALNANDYFLIKNGQPRPVFKQNQFGASFDGPLRKNKTFFFAEYQGTIQRNGFSNTALQTATLPPLTNDRSALKLGSIFGGQSGAFGGAAVASDGSNINPVALAILNFKFPNGKYAIPTPQVINSQGLGQFSFSSPAHYREDQIGVDLDHAFSQQNQLAGRFFYSRAPVQEPFSPFGANIPGWGLRQTERNHMFVLSDTHVFTPHVINVARFGFMRFDGLAVGDEPMSAADVGMATPSGLPEIPGIAVGGLFTIGPDGQPFYFENVNTFVWQDTVSVVHGRHNLRLGAEAKRHQLDVNVPFVKDGFLFFLSFPDFLLGESAAQNGSPVSNVFSSTGASGNFRKDERYRDWAGFLQDDIKINSRLTLNAGLRYEFFGAPSEIHGRLPTFDVNNASLQVPITGSFSGFVLPANYPGQPPAEVTKAAQSGMWRPDYNDISPRLGFALRLHDGPTVVLRGGYGIYYQRLSGQLAQQVVGQPPFSFTQALQGSQNALATFQQPYKPLLPPDSSFPVFQPRLPESVCAADPSRNCALTVASVGQNLTSPYTQQYDLNVQYEFARDFLWQVGYVGSASTHLTGCTEFNQALIATPQTPVNGQTTTTVENLAQRLPFQGIAGGATYICKTAFSASYNSLQTSVSKRFGHGLDFQAAYTWSKELDHVSGTGVLDSLDLSFLSNDQTNPRQARGPGDFSRPHRFVLSFVYQPPTIHMGPALARHMLSHWQFSGEAVLQSGLPITVTDDRAGSVYGNLTGLARAECTGANQASSGPLSQRLQNYFNLAAFTDAPAIGDGTGFGNCGVGILRGPDQRNLDLGIQRNFPLSEKSAVQFRAEFFNFTNTPKFGQPASDRGLGPAFGAITFSASAPRIVQFALKYNF